MSRPFVSVIIDTYNHEAFIEQAIASTLDQDFPASDREILVVDDGSTDRTSELLAKFGQQIRVLHKSNGGQASAFNLAIPQCRGEIIVFLDGDDWWKRGKLQRVSDLMDKDPNIGMVGHAIIESFNDGSERVIAPETQTRFRLQSRSSAEFFRVHRCYFGTSRLALRSSLLRKVSPVPEALIIEADEYLFTLAAALADSIVLTDPLTHYRIHGANLFMAPGAFSGGERRKQRAISALASELRHTLPAIGTPPEATAAVLELVDAEASQLLLQLDGGPPWATYRAERTLYRIQHPDAPWRSRAFRGISMVPALLLPPRWFYGGRRWLGSQPWYKHARSEFVPLPQATQVKVKSANQTTNEY